MSVWISLVFHQVSVFVEFYSNETVDYQSNPNQIRIFDELGYPSGN